MKPSAATTAWAGRRDGLLTVDGDLDLRDRRLAEQPGDLGLGDDLDVELAHRLRRCARGHGTRRGGGPA